MALGTTALVKQIGHKQSDPTRAVFITQVGDGAYPAGGTAGFKAKVKAALGLHDLTIMAVIDQSNLADEVEYDHVNDKLFVRVKATGVESAVANQSGVTYRMLVLIG
jgi:hypothetical protein